jgi:long-chain acyl-CoA synthetase
VLSWGDALDAGAASPAEPVPPSPDDYCTIMYTSGTTGESAGC